MSATKRRAKNHQRQQWIYDMDVDTAFRTDSLPRYALAVSICSCGRRSWLMPGATDEDYAAHYEDDANHAYMHDMEDDQ